MSKTTGVGRGNNPNSHRNRPKGADHYRWNGGKIRSSHGYVRVRVGRDHPLADPNGYAYEHLLVWVSAGRSLPRPDEAIHHKNEDKGDNRIENLELKDRVSHGVHHNPTALTDEQVRSIRERYLAGDDTRVISLAFNIKPQYAWKIVRGMTRRSAGGPIVNQPLRKLKADGREHSEFPA